MERAVKTDTQNATALPGADAVRALACAWVLLIHLHLFVGEPFAASTLLGRFIRAGEHGVAMFFVLSGFLLSMPFWKSFHQHKPPPSLRIYAWRRLGRIVPAYYANILILAALGGHLFTAQGLAVVVTAMAFVHTFFPDTVMPSFNGALWTIGTEMVFYVLLPVVALPLFRLRNPWLVRGATVALIAIIVAAQAAFLRVAPWPSPGAWASPVDSDIWRHAFHTTWVIESNAIYLFTHFLVGFLAADAHVALGMRQANDDGTKRGGSRFNAADAIIVLAGASALAISLLDRDTITRLPLLWRTRPFWQNIPPSLMQYHFPAFHVLVAALLVAAPRSASLGRWLNHAIFRVTARYSYGIYLWHAPVLMFFVKRWPRPTSATAGDALWHMLAISAVAVPVIFLISAASYHLLESPLLRWTHRRSA